MTILNSVKSAMNSAANRVISLFNTSKSPELVTDKEPIT